MKNKIYNHHPYLLSSNVSKQRSSVSSDIFAPPPSSPLYALFSLPLPFLLPGEKAA